MKILGYVLYETAGGILGLNGLGPSTWQYWVIVLCFVLGGIFVND